jgi:PAS domain S-box-containing protein
MPEDLCHLWETALKKVFSTGLQQTLEFDFPSQQGTRSFILKFVPEFDLNGHTVCQVLGVSSEITVRKQAEETLRYQSELLDRISDAVISTDSDLRIRSWNKAAEAIYGWTAGEALGHHMHELLRTEFVGMGQEEAYKRLALNGLAQVEVIHQDRHGCKRFVETSVSLLKNECGETTGTLGVLRDITARKHAQKALLENERKLSMAVSATADAIWEWNLLTNQAYYSPRWYEMLGYQDNEITMDFDGWKNLCHPDDLQPTLNLIHSRLASDDDAGYAAEFRMRSKDGMWLWILGRGRVMERDQAGRAVLLSGTNADITERKQAEEALRQSEAKFSKLFHESPSFLCITDFENSKYMMVNKAYCELTGYSEEEIIGKTALELGFVTQDDRLKMIKELNEIGNTNTCESRIRTKSGEIRTRMLSVAVIEIHGKRAIISSGLDITDRKQAEQAIKQLNETLEQKVEERTELARSRSNQLQALAVELIEAEEREKRRIAELIHDDLQQVLAAARLHLESICEEDPTYAPRLSDVICMLTDSVCKARQLSHELSPAVLHQLGLVAGLKGLCRQVSKRFGLTVRLTAKNAERYENIPLRDFLYRAVQELLFNIVKHAGVKRASVILSSSENEVRVTVSDKGQGFNSAILDSIPERVGLGLLSLRERASYLGGSLTIESTPGRGSRFSLALPLEVQAEDLQSLENYAISPPYKKTTCDTGGVRALFVDDHQVIRQGLIRLISGKPDIVVVGEAGNGKDAIELARQLIPDVIVMDVSMPVMDGIEATRHIKAELPQVRIIGLTMHEDDQLIGAMKQAGAEVTLSKTTSASELIKTIYGKS